MEWIWILAVVLGIPVLLFLLPVSLKIGFDGEVTLGAGLPGLYFPILPKKPRKYNLKNYTSKKYRRLLERDRLALEKKKRKKLEKAEKKEADGRHKKEERAKKLPPEHPAEEPSVVQLILPLVGGILDTFAGKIRVRLIRLDIRVGGTDAAQIALMHGLISQGVAYLIALISQKTRYSSPGNARISVTADFLLAKTQADIQIIFRLRLADILSTAIVFLIRFLKRKANFSAGTSNPVKKEVQT